MHGIGRRDPLSMCDKSVLVSSRLKIEVGATHKLKLHHGLKTNANALSWFTATIAHIDAKLRLSLPRHLYF
jgi:hypothetical protein